MIVGNERAFLEWFYERSSVTAGAIETDAVEEYLRTFAGRESVLASLGVFRTVFRSMEQTLPLLSDRVRVPVVGLGGERSRGETIGRALERVAEHVQTGVIFDSGHFVPEEQPDQLARWSSMGRSDELCWGGRELHRARDRPHRHHGDRSRPCARAVA